jgi:hypothetical protein
MAISITLPSQGTSQSNATAASQPISFLDHCIEDLSADKIASFDKTTNFWHIVSGVSIVAFFALAIGLFITTGFLVPFYLPFVGLGATLLAIPAVWQIQKFQQWAETAQIEANKSRAIQQHYTDLTTQTPLQLQRALLQMGIVWNHIPGMQIQHPENITRLNPLIAHAKFYETRTVDYLKEKDKYAAEAQQLTQPEDLPKRTELDKAALLCEGYALFSKLRNGIINAALRNPNMSKASVDDFATISESNYHAKFGGNTSSGASNDQFLIFKNRNLAPVTFDDLKRLSVAELGQRIFAAMPAA